MLTRTPRATNRSLIGFTLLFAVAACAPGEVLPPGTELWTRQFGTSSNEQTGGATVDSGGNIYVGGSTLGSLAGASAGGRDAFVRKLDGAGSTLWTDQFGTAASDGIGAAVVDQDGNVFVVGTTFGDLDAGNFGFDDLFVRKYAPNGTVLWTRQFGTSGNDTGNGVAVDAPGNVLVVGYVTGNLEGVSAGGADAVVRKYNAAGGLLWTRQFGTSDNDSASSVATDAAGNVFVAGSTGGLLDTANFGLGDAFVRKYDASGDLLWTRQFGTSANDLAAAVVASAAGSVFVAGRTAGDLDGPSAGGTDGFVRAYDAQGDLLWGRQIGTASLDAVNALSADAAGDLAAAGLTEGALVGANAGLEDAFVLRLDSQGETLWLRQFGTPQDETVSASASDSAGNPVVVGITSGTLTGANAGGFDVYVRKLSD